MSTIRLFLDEVAAQRDLMAALRVREVDVTRAQDEGLIGASDRQQLEWCRGQGRVIYTFNVKDFSALNAEYLRTGLHHAGIILAPQRRYSVEAKSRRPPSRRKPRCAWDRYSTLSLGCGETEWRGIRIEQWDFIASKPC